MNTLATPEVPKTKHHSMALTSQMFMPTNYPDAIKFCELAAKEDFIPTAMKNKPMTLFLAWQMGAAVGLDFFASIQNIAVINGKPCIYGDAALAVIMNHPYYQEHEEWYEVKGQRVTSFLATDPDLVAFCSITRKGQKPTIKSFSVKDAIQAKLWEKPGVWQQYPSRMLQFRARGFCSRDAIPGALKGLSIREEVIDLPAEDYHVVETREQPKLGAAAVINAISQITPTEPVITAEVAEEESVNPETGEVMPSSQSIAGPSFADIKKQMEESNTVEELIFARDVARSAGFIKSQIDELAIIFKQKQTTVKP